MRVALLNVKFSPNLGDGLLAECLERELSQALGGALVFSIDIAGRTGWQTARDLGGKSKSGRRRLLALLEALPPPLRRMAAGSALALLSALVLRRHVRRRLAGCHAAVIGGGNLLTDADLNFPIKLAGASREVARRRLPLAVHAVGASRNWSGHGRALFSRALARRPLAHAAVRDLRSQEAWTTQLVPRGAGPAAVVGDPGLLASLHYARPTPLPRPNGERRVGLCITAPLALRYHVGRHHGTDGPLRAERSASSAFPWTSPGALPPDSFRADSSRAEAGLIEWYGSVAHALAQQGLQVVLFTNGSPEDRECLAAHAPRWTLDRPAAAWLGGAACLARGRVSLAAPFVTPADLAAFVSGCDLVIAHRMHACIAAHSFAVPTIGLTWDEKLTSFFAIAGRSRYAVDGLSTTPSAMVELAQSAMAEGVDRAALDTLIARTQEDVALLGERLAAVARIA